MKNGQSELDFCWQEILKLAPGECFGNRRGIVTRYDGYMLLEVEAGIKRTSCLDAARVLAKISTLEEAQELPE